MSQFELLKEVVRFLTSSDIPYMLTGSIVSSFQGEPRSTHDIDMMILLKKENIPSFIQSFSSPIYYVDEDRVLNAIQFRKMFNLLNTMTGDKVDFYILPENDYEITRFKRKIQENINGMMFWITTPEDTILSKLRWCKLSNNSEKQFKDALRVFEIQYDILDFTYIQEWITELNLGDLYRRLQVEREDL